MMKKILAVLVLILLTAPPALYFGMKLSPLSWGLVDPVNNESGIALRGTDPVSYFTEASNVAGDPRIGLRHDGVIYRFSSEANRLMFKTFPDRFTPRYGGYCATAIATGFTIDANPEYWHITDDSLYLFFSASSRDDFISQIEAGIIQRADHAWETGR